MVFQVFGVVQAEILPKHAKPSIPPSHEFTSGIFIANSLRSAAGFDFTMS